MEQVTADVPLAAVVEIRAKLAELRHQHDVAIPLAIESGSRAWGFPSPHSDYDCRFIFVRSLDAYLSPWTSRDVIEMPLDAVYDVNGWELGKALKLMLKGNAVVLEWLQSPYVYEGEPAFRTEFLEMARRHADRKSIGLHYLHLGQNQWRMHFGSPGDEVPLKKVFYAMRPAAALRWMALHPDEAIPPMNFITLMRQCDPSNEVSDYVTELLRRKALTRELGQAVVPSALLNFITVEFAAAQERLGTLRRSVAADAQGEVEAFFRRTVKKTSPNS